MPRSNTSSCAHEQHHQDQQENCNCNTKASLFKRRVISEQMRGEWHTVALSMILLFMHMVLIFKIAGISLSSCLISLNEWNTPAPVAPLSAEVRAEQSSQAPPISTDLRVPDYGGSGTLAALSDTGEALGHCVLKNTAVIAKVSGGLAHVSVTQKFSNPFKSKIQAVYAFPLDEHCAVESMQMHCGSRVVTGEIKQRAEAEALYQSAAKAGQTAALLEEDRPNIFTQSVANINPGEDVSVSLNYISVLPFENGDYTFTFPTTIGTRFIPGEPIGNRGVGTAYDTNIVHDASRISPPSAHLQTRPGHDITLKVILDSPFPVSNIVSKLHKVTVAYSTGNTPVILLNRDDKIPNRDFVLSWHAAKESVQTGVLTHRTRGDGYVSLTLMPPDRFDQKTSGPKELIFLVDCSGSQDGPPLEKAKETLSYIADHMGPQDTLQILSFNDSVGRLYERPKAMNFLDKVNAKAFIKTLTANGGTFMAPAVAEACSVRIDPNRLRIITFMTDGFVGNDREIIGLVKKFRGTSRWFCFGTGNSVNRYLIDGIARAGGGEAEYVLMNSPSEKIAESFWKKISSPILTNIKVDFGKLAVYDVVPNVPSDVWSRRPLTFSARYSKPGRGVITITGFAGGKKYVHKVPVLLQAFSPGREVIGTLWARQKIELLCDEDNLEIATGYRHKHEYQITKLGLEHHLLTPYTSFVAIDRHLRTDKPKRVSHKGTHAKCDDALQMYVESTAVPVDPRYGQSNEIGYVNDTYMGIKRFWGDDIIGNVFQNVGQLIGKWISEWINGILADTCR